jgi:hypothetical protein
MHSYYGMSSLMSDPFFYLVRSPNVAGRVTLIYPNSDNEWGSDGVGRNAIFLGYEPDEQKRSAWQLTLNDVKQVAQCEFLENINSYHERYA